MSEATNQVEARLAGFGSGVRNDPGPSIGELRNVWKPTAQSGLAVYDGPCRANLRAEFYSGL